MIFSRSHAYHLFISLSATMLLACACIPASPSPDMTVARVTSTPAPQVIFQGETPAKEELQTIDGENCAGKATATWTETRKQSIDSTISAEIAAKLGASGAVISAEVQTAVGIAMGVTKGREASIQVSAPPGTHMIFQLAWTGPEQIGVVQFLRGSDIPIAFRSFTPTAVRIKNQIDVGCPTPSGPAQGEAIKTKPTVSQPTSSPLLSSVRGSVCTGRISRSEVAKWATSGSTMDKKLIEGYLQEFYSKQNGSWDFTDVDRIPTGVLIATDFNNRGESDIWKNYPLKFVAHYRSYGLFETIGEFKVPEKVTGQCLAITP